MKITLSMILAVILVIMIMPNFDFEVKAMDQTEKFDLCQQKHIQICHSHPAHFECVVLMSRVEK